MTDPILPFAVWAAGTNQASIPANDNALRSEILAGRVISKTTAAQPAGVDGAIYIIPSGATGAMWATFTAGDLAIYRGGTWYAYAPVAGLVVNMLGTLQQWSGAAWADLGGGSSGPAPVVPVSGASHDVTAAEVGSYLRFTGSGTKTCTFRPEATHALPPNGEWHIRNAGAGNLTLTPGSGVTLNAPYSGTLVVPPLGTVTVKRVAADVFDVLGVTI